MFEQPGQEIKYRVYYYRHDERVVFLRKKKWVGEVWKTFLYSDKFLRKKITTFRGRKGKKALWDFLKKQKGKDGLVLETPEKVVIEFWTNGSGRREERVEEVGKDGLGTK